MPDDAHDLQGMLLRVGDEIAFNSGGHMATGEILRIRIGPVNTTLWVHNFQHGGTVKVKRAEGTVKL